MLDLGQESWDQVADRIEAAEGPVAWAWLAARERDAWKFLVLTVRGATQIANNLDRYAAIIVCTEQLTPKEAAVRFRHGVTGGLFDPPFQFGPIAENSWTHWLTTERPGAYTFPIRWPRFYAEFNIRTDGSPQVAGKYEPLSRKDERFHHDVMSAVSEMLYGVPPTVLRNDLTAAVRVVLPDRRARFGKIEFAGGRTDVAIDEGWPGSARGLLLRAAWRDDPDDATWARVDAPISTGHIQVPTDRVPAHMSLIIATGDGAPIDQYSWSPESGKKPIDRDVPSEQVERWLIEGEHLTLEFKRELDEDSAKRSFAEDVCAFANTSGGVVLVGVDDDRTVVGYERPKVEDKIQNIVRNLVTGPPWIDVQRVITRGGPVYVVSVRESAFDIKPHMVGTQVWLRAGGTTFRATPDELRRLLRPPVEPGRFAMLR